MLDIERTDQHLIVKLPLDLPVEDIQQMLDYLAYKQSVGTSKATDAEIDQLAREIKSGYWESIKDRFKEVEGFEAFFTEEE